MTPDEAVEVVSTALVTGDYDFTFHFRNRLAQRGLIFGDVQAAVSDPRKVWFDGHDQDGRERWFFRGKTTRNLTVEVLAAVEVDANFAVFVTLYWS